MTPEEAGHLCDCPRNSRAPRPATPKLAAVQVFPDRTSREGRSMAGARAASSSASITTPSYSLGAELARLLPGEPIGVYAGAGQGGSSRPGLPLPSERENIKRAVKQGRFAWSWQPTRPVRA